MLILENGTGVANADSFVSLSDARAFAASRGKPLPEDDTEAEAVIRNAHDYLLTVEETLQGTRSTTTQRLPFPRTDVTVYGQDIGASEIPASWLQVVLQVIVAQNGSDLTAITAGAVVIKESVGPISTTYDTALSSRTPFAPTVVALLGPFKKSGTALRTLRV